jgi:hypothetical protein
MVGEQQRGETLRGCRAKLNVDGAASGRRLRRRGTVSGGHDAGVDYLEHDVRAARDDELAGQVEVKAAVVDEQLGAVLCARKSGLAAELPRMLWRSAMGASRSTPTEGRRVDPGRSSPLRRGRRYARARGGVKAAARLSDLARARTPNVLQRRENGRA